MRIAAFDIGSKYTGYAITDPAGIMPVKSGIIEASLEELPEKIEEIVLLYSIEKVVVGLPVTLKGTHSLQTESVKKLITKLKDKVRVPVLEFDERLTTVEAQKIWRKLGHSQQEKKKLNEIAAWLILESFLKRRKNNDGG